MIYKLIILAALSICVVQCKSKSDGYVSCRDAVNSVVELLPLRNRRMLKEVVDALHKDDHLRATSYLHTFLKSNNGVLSMMRQAGFAADDIHTLYYLAYQATLGRDLQTLALYLSEHPHILNNVRVFYRILIGEHLTDEKLLDIAFYLKKNPQIFSNLKKREIFQYADNELDTFLNDIKDLITDPEDYYPVEDDDDDYDSILLYTPPPTSEESFDSDIDEEPLPPTESKQPLPNVYDKESLPPTELKQSQLPGVSTPIPPHEIPTDFPTPTTEAAAVSPTLTVQQIMNEKPQSAPVPPAGVPFTILAKEAEPDLSLLPSDLERAKPVTMVILSSDQKFAVDPNEKCCHFKLAKPIISDSCGTNFKASYLDGTPIPKFLITNLYGDKHCKVFYDDDNRFMTHCYAQISIEPDLQIVRDEITFTKFRYKFGTQIKFSHHIPPPDILTTNKGLQCISNAIFQGLHVNHGIKANLICTQE